jgi:hypothetical protein
MKKVNETVVSKDQKEVKTVVKSSEKKAVSETVASKPSTDKLSAEEEKKRAIARFLGYM